jgi:hypothetical protein
MASDPYPPKTPDPWVTSSPGQPRGFDSGPDNIAMPPLLTRGAQWGLTSLLLGIPLLAGSPVLLLLLRSFWTMGPAGMRVPVAFAAGIGGLGLILGLAAAGAAFGVRGWVIAASERQPIALGLGGVMLNGVAFLVWLGIAIDMMSFFLQHLH